MPQSLLLSFKKNVSLINEPTNNVVVKSPYVRGNNPEKTLKIEQVTPGLLAAIETISTNGATEEQLSDLVLQTDGIAELPKFYYYLQKFTENGMLCHTVVCEGVPLATRVTNAPSEKFQYTEAVKDKKYVLSRFAYCRKEEDQLVLESPLSHAKIILSGWQGAALIAELAQPHDCQKISSKIPNISEAISQLFFSLLLSSNLLCEVPEDGKIQEEENETLAHWEFHDLLFHSRIRWGRHSNPVGKTFRFLEKIEQPPIVKPKMSDDIIELYKPDLEKLKKEDTPFTQVLEERKSIRGYQEDTPITAQQLGEFLYRSARTTRKIAKDYGECDHRPYANGGGRYELELYLAVNICDNLSSGFYHYRPKEHQLCRLTGRNSQVEVLIEEASLATKKQCVPQVLIIYAARFPRVAWVYQSIAYSLILKDVGSLQQTMYLVATAMNLAPCAIGVGDAELFANLAGTDYYAESSVGEFILGSKPTQ